MHNQIVGSTGVDSNSHVAHDSSYGNNNWVDMNAYSHGPAMQTAMQTSMPDYGGTAGGGGGGFHYVPALPHGLPSESLNRMPPPPAPAQTMVQPQVTHPPLSMLIMPSQAPWPSMYTNPTSYAPQVPPLIVPQVNAPVKPAKPPQLSTGSQPRKTLTDDDRRRMCEYYVANPTAKQTEIGNMFGVERSTVSKVLRQKEKYLATEERSTSPVKRVKGKTPDVEKTLTNWIRNAEKSGVELSDAEIEEKARFFAATTGSPSDNPFKKGISSTWLQKFKQKNGIGHGRLMRRASETNISDSTKARKTLSPSQPSSAVSPSSPQTLASPSPLSASRADEDKDSIAAFMDYGLSTESSGGYKHTNSQSTTSLSSAFTDTAGSSFSGSALSPSGTLSFSPDPNSGDFLPAPGSSNFHRPRSQTFPTLHLEFSNQQQQQGEPLTPKYHVSSTAPSSALESPANEIPQPQYNLDSAVVSPQLHHRSSNSSLAARQASGTPVTSSAVPSTPLGSAPGSPTQDDARRAADTLLTFLNHVSTAGFVDQNEYMTVVRLTERLRLHQHQMATGASQGIGGLSRIPEADSEMPNAPPVTMTTVEPTTMSV